MSDQHQSVVFGITRKSLEATLIYACLHCGAPGVYKSDERTRLNWPGCWREEANGQTPVGKVCPNCKKWRANDNQLGELTASMPKWLWRSILGIKWSVIKIRAIGGRYGRTLHRT